MPHTAGAKWNEKWPWTRQLGALGRTPPTQGRTNDMATRGGPF